MKNKCNRTKRFVPHIGIVAITLIAFGYGACYLLNPQTITMADYVLLNGNFVEQLRESSCASDRLEVRNEMEAQFQTALEAREVQCSQWASCDCEDSIIVHESNCDTTELDATVVELEDTLDDCADANALLTEQVYNLIYTP